jgi:hypothetical protein
LVFPLLLAAACGDDALLSPGTRAPGAAALSRQSANNPANGSDKTPAAATITGTDQPLSVGQAVQLGITYSSTPNPGALKRHVMIWRSSDTTAVVVDASGRAVARRAGATATVTASTVAGVASTQVTTTAGATPPVATPPAPTPAPSAAVALTVIRFDGGTGRVLVSNGIPLRPGMLRPDQLRNVHVTVNNAEQALHVEALRGRHPDGSLRSVLVQFRYDMGTATRVPATFTIGEPRQGDDLARPTESRSVPAAAALPDSPDYLVATDLVGPTVTAARTAGMSPAIDQWEADYAKFGDYQWAQSGEDWGGNFYDRAGTAYAMWARTGNPTYWVRATRMVVNYRKNYVEANNASSPHWAQIPGLERHYRLTGDTASVAAINTITYSISFWQNNLGPESGDVDNRVRARTIQSVYTQWRLAETETERAPLASKLDMMLTRVLANQDSVGAYRAKNACGESMPYMDGMLNDVLIELFENYRADPRILPAIRKNADYIWTLWRPELGGISYVSGNCPGVGTTDSFPVLNNLIVNSFIWTFSRGGGTWYRDRADDLMAGAVRGAWLYNTKEFNQHYVAAYRYLFYRR